MNTAQQQRAARIAQARANVRHLHTQMVAWALAPESVGVKAFAVGHFAMHKARALKTLQGLITSV